MNTPEDYQAALASWSERQRFEIETGQDRQRIEIETGRGGQRLETETAPLRSPTLSLSLSLSLSLTLSPSPWNFSAWPSYSRRPRMFHCRYRHRPRCPMFVRRLRPSTQSCSAGSSIRTGVASRAAMLATLTGLSLSKIPTPRSIQEIRYLFFRRMPEAEPCMAFTDDCSISI